MTCITDITDTLHFLRFQSMTRHDMTLLHILTYGSCAHGKGHTYMQTVGPETSFKPGLGAMEIACNAMEIAAKQYTLARRHTYMQTRQVLEAASNQALGLWKLLARRPRAKQPRGRPRGRPGDRP